MPSPLKSDNSKLLEMKHLILLAAMVSLFAGCTSIRHFNGNEVSSIVLRTNETFTIDLPGNATTGFAWECNEDDASRALVEKIGESYAADRSRRNLVGAPGVFQFQFRAKSKGSCLLEFGYQRPWEKDRPPSAVREIRVTVE